MYTKHEITERNIHSNASWKVLLEGKADLVEKVSSPHSGK